MKEATSLLQKVRSAALRRLLLDEARRWLFVACALILLLQAGCEFLNQASAIIKILCSVVLLLYTILRLKLLRVRVPTLRQTARRLEERDAELSGVLSAALEFESSSVVITTDSLSLRKETINNARRRLEKAFEEGRVCELRDVALNLTENKRRNRLDLLERAGTYCLASLLVARFVWFAWFATREKTPETPSFQPARNETKTESKGTTNPLDENVQSFRSTSSSLGDDLAFLRETLVRSVSLADSLTRELRDARSDSIDATLLFQLAREFDSSFRSPFGLVAAVANIRVSFVLPPKQDVDVMLLDCRLREFDEYLRENQNVGIELARLLATTTRSFSSDLRNEALENALKALERTRERLLVEERALDFLSFGVEFSRKLTELEQERATLLQSAVDRLQARPGALSDVDASELKTDDFLVSLDLFEQKWKERRDELKETARRLSKPEAEEFVAFVKRFANQTDSYALFFGNGKTQVDLTRRFERPLASARLLERHARSERWGKAATLLSETSDARETPGSDVCEEDDFSATLAWRLAFGVFDGAGADLKDFPLNVREAEERKSSATFEKTPSREGIDETLDQTARDAEIASQPISFSEETQFAERLNQTTKSPLKSNRTSEEGTETDENYEGGASAQEAIAPIKNKTNAFSGELPNVAKSRLTAGKRWNPPPEIQEKERAFQVRLREETRKNQNVDQRFHTSSDASK